MPESDPLDASPAEMCVYPIHYHCGAVLSLERERAFDPEYQGRRSGRPVLIAPSSPERPLQLDRPGMARKRLADNGRPIGD